MIDQSSVRSASLESPHYTACPWWEFLGANETGAVTQFGRKEGSWDQLANTLQLVTAQVKLWVTPGTAPVSKRRGWGLLGAGRPAQLRRPGLGRLSLWHWFIQEGGRGCDWEGDGEQTAVTLTSRWGEPGGSGARLPRGPSSCWHREARQEEGSEASLTEERRRDSRSGQWRVQVSDAQSGSVWITCRHRLGNAPHHGVQSSYCRKNEWQSQQN